MWRQMLRFGTVGALATFVHMVIGALLISSSQPALVANLIAFVTAFLLSFVGHLGYSFADEDVQPARALWRFAAVALSGFGCNEALLFVLTSQTVLSDTTALWVSTGSAAMLTFLLSRTWAFRSPQEIDIDTDPFPARPGISLTNR